MPRPVKLKIERPASVAHRAAKSQETEAASARSHEVGDTADEILSSATSVPRTPQDISNGDTYHLPGMDADVDKLWLAVRAEKDGARRINAEIDKLRLAVGTLEAENRKVWAAVKELQGPLTPVAQPVPRNQSKSETMTLDTSRFNLQTSFATSLATPDDGAPITPSQVGGSMTHSRGMVAKQQASVVSAILEQEVLDQPIIQAGLDTGDVTVDSWGFRQSCWDAAAFVGSPELLVPGETIVIVLLLVLNVAMQVSFVIITLASLATPRIDDDVIAGYHTWRTNTGHAYQFRDPFTEQSLASRVCDGDPALHWSDTQKDQVADVDAYLYDHFPFNGPLMCILAMLTWALTISKEFHVLKDMLFAVWMLESGHTHLVVGEDNNRLKIKSMSFCRKSFISFLASFRAVFAAVLLYAGAKYLAVTISVEDILLNAVALEFVIGVDELLYVALAPEKTRRMMLLLAPLRVPKAPALKGADLDVFIWTSFLVAFSIAAVFGWLVPEMDKMRVAKHEICGGDLGFAYTLSVGNYIVWAPEVPAQVASLLESAKHTARYHTLRSIIDGNIDASVRGHRATHISGPGLSVGTYKQWTLPNLVMNVNPLCNDLSTNGTINVGFALSAVRDTVGNQSIVSCAEIVNECNQYTYGALRLVCSITCGCRKPESSLLLLNANEGCSQYCGHQYTPPVSTNPQQNWDCIERNASDLVLDGTWRRLAQGYPLATSVLNAWERARFQRVSDWMLIYGCGAVTNASNILRLNMCDFPTSSNLSHLKPIALWCPISCDCATYGLSYDNCPRSCSPGNVL